MNQRLYRSRDDRIIFGVAGGIANQFNVDPSLIRILWVVLAIATFGAALLLYVAMAFIVPEEPAGADRWARWEKAGSGGYQWPDSGATGSPGSGVPSASFVATPGVTDVDPATVPIGTEAIPGAAPAWTAQQARASAGDARASARDFRHSARAERHHAGIDGHGALIAGLVLVVVGGFFLVRQYVPSVDVEQAWPVLLVIVGAVLLVGAVRRSPGASA